MMHTFPSACWSLAAKYVLDVVNACHLILSYQQECDLPGMTTMPCLDAELASWSPVMLNANQHSAIGATALSAFVSEL